MIVNKRGRTPFQEAILGGNIPTITYMLDNHMSATGTKERFLSTFELTLRTGDVQTASTFAEYMRGEAIWEQQGLNMLRKAIKHTHVYYVRCLLSSKSLDINSRYETGDIPIRHATKVGHAGIVEALLSSKKLKPNMKIGYNPHSALHIAVERDYHDIVVLLLQDYRVNVNIQDASGATPLHLASERDKVDIARLILVHPKVDVNKVDNYGETPLFKAIQRSRVLLNSMHDDSATARHATNVSEGPRADSAITCSHLQVVHVLCQASGIGYTVKDEKGRSPLHSAVLEGCWPIAQCLLRYTEAKQRSDASSEIRLPVFRVSHLPKLLKELIRHEDFQSTYGFKNLLFSAALYRLSEVVGLMSQTQAFENVVMGDDTAAALLCAVCTASHDTKALEYILQQPNTDVKCWVDKGMTALHVAVAIRSTEAVAILLQHRQIDIGLRTGYFLRLEHQDDWRDNGWYPWYRTARQLARFKYGPQSDIENPFAAHERSKWSAIAFPPDQVNQVGPLDINTNSHPSQPSLHRPSTSSYDS